MAPLSVISSLPVVDVPVTAMVIRSLGSRRSVRLTWTVRAFCSAEPVNWSLSPVASGGAAAGHARICEQIQPIDASIQRLETGAD